MLPKEIIVFLNSDFRNAWVKLPYGELYLRNTNRYIEDKRRWTIDVANVTVKEKERGKGHFKQLIDDLEAGLGHRGVEVLYAENIHEPRLMPFFERRGYKIDPYTTENCFYKLLELK